MDNFYFDIIIWIMEHIMSHDNERFGTAPIPNAYIVPRSKEELDYFKKNACFTFSSERKKHGDYILYALENGKIHPQMKKEG